MRSDNIPIYIAKDFKKMRKAGRLAAHVLDQLYELITPGISTLEINDFCHSLIIKNKAIPAPLNYKGFPKSVCTSVNHVVCHGIPSENKILNNGDIINATIKNVLFTNWCEIYLNKNQSGTFFDKLCVNLEIIFIVEIRKDY